jgi:hypothetical protein
MRAEGVPFTEICRRLGIPRGTVSYWLYRRGVRDAPVGVERCFRCARPARPPADPPAYAYLLGQYLGDGHLLMTQRMPVLSVYCDMRHPGIAHEIATAMTGCGTRTAGFVEKTGCIAVRSYWNHWPCLIPQHGPGKKHNREIRLAEWQQEIVAQHAGRFLRGLFHSDGTRVINRVRSPTRAYAYVRYMFVNESEDIMGLCQEALDQLGIRWRMARRNSLSVARREAVAALDEHVGPKW